MKTGTQLLDQEKIRDWGTYIKSLPEGDLKNLETCAFDAFHDEAERISQRGVHDGCYRGLTSWYHYVGKSGLAIKASYRGIGGGGEANDFGIVMKWVGSHDRPWVKDALEIMHLVRSGKVKAVYNPELIHDQEKYRQSRQSLTVHTDRVEWDFEHYLWGLVYHRLEILVMGNCLGPEQDPWGDKDVCLDVIDISDTLSGSLTFEDMGLPELIPGVGFSLKSRSKGKYGTPARTAHPVISPKGHCAPGDEVDWAAWISGKPKSSPAPTPTDQPADTEIQPVIAAEIDSEAEKSAAILMDAEAKIESGVVRKIVEAFPRIKEEVRNELLAETVDIEAEIEKRFPPEREKAKQKYKEGLVAKINKNMAE